MRSTNDEHRAYGAELRKTKPPAWMANWEPARSREPLAVLDRAGRGRDPKLVEDRSEAMAEDDPAFFRCAAGVMASDLRTSRSDVTNIWLDVCGDAHIGNFGTYGSRNDTGCSISTTSTRLDRRRGSGTSAGWPPARSWSRAT